MTKIVKTIPIPATQKVILDYLTCDLCGEKIVHSSDNMDECTVKRTEGYKYSDCGGGTDTVFDICGECFESKLIPWMAEQKASPRVEDWDY
jgi:hypothetical protein